MIVEHLARVTAARLRMLTENVPVRTAASALSVQTIGLIVVCDETGRTAGVLSKSDLVHHLSVMGSPEAPVSLVMTRKVVDCAPGDLLDDAWEAMRSRRLQNMPVLDPNRRPIGVLDIRDALQAILKAEQDQEHLLVNYIAGFGYR